MALGKPAWITEVTDNTFEREVIQASAIRPVVVDFWAPWCGPCRVLTPILEKVIGEQEGAVVLAKVNIDESPALAAQFQIQGIPLVIGFRSSKPAAEFMGVQPEQAIRQFVQRLLPTSADKLVEQAKHVETNDAVAAEQQYRAALKADPRHEGAALGLARVLLARGEDKEIIALLQEVTTTGSAGEEADRLRATAWLRQVALPFGEEAALREYLKQQPKKAELYYQLGCVLAAQGKYQEALETLLAAAERDPHLASSKVREAMVKVFHIIGDRSPLANEFREKLGTLLY
jgi:putative thioredoxin